MMKRSIYITKVKISKTEKKAVEKVFDSGMIAQGPKVAEFEKRFAKFCGAKYGVATNSGTAALHCACYAVGIGAGDEVITTPFTFVASANAILMVGGKVVFTDIEEETFNIDPQQIKRKISYKTKVIIPIDLFGHPYDYSAVKKIIKKKKILIVEDACQAVGAKYKGYQAGMLGDIGCFSFYATKNMLTGEGGMLVTNNQNFAEKAKMLRHHGQSEKKRYQYFDLGYNYRMTDFVAALGIEQLKKVERLNKQRIKNAQFYLKELANTKGLVLPKTKKGVKHVFHQFTMRITGDFKLNRDQFFDYLKEKGIYCGVYYPKPLHLHPHFQKMGYKKGDFPVAERLAQEVISLPIHPYLTKSELKYIVDTIKTI